MNMEVFVSDKKKFLFVCCDDDSFVRNEVYVPSPRHDEAAIISASRSDSNSSFGSIGSAASSISPSSRPRARSPSDRQVISNPAHYMWKRLRPSSFSLPSNGSLFSASDDS